jgi:polyphosphate kinase
MAIWVKLNSLVDPDIMRSFYTKPAAPGEIELIIRGTSLRPGVPGMSENTKVRLSSGVSSSTAASLPVGNG